MKLTKLASLMIAATFAGSAFAECEPGTTPVDRGFNKETCMLDQAPYKSDLTLDSDRIWVLSGKVAIGGDNQDSATLYIQPGTKIVGDSGKDYLLIRRGSKIIARGTETQPIIMTSSKPAGERARGDWGGLVISGNAPVNGCGREFDQNQVCEPEGEGDSGKYGGNNPEDNSGVLNYVIVEYAGNEVTKGDELNGIAFQGVGSKTEVDYIQAHMGFDDGIEFFGGTVNVKHMISTGNQDDSVDWTFGWQGKAQFVYIKQNDDFANNGIEADNNDQKLDSYPRSLPTLSNLTIIGAAGEGKASGQGILLREGTGALISNAIVTGFKKSCLDIDDSETFSFGADRENLSIDTSIVNCASNFDEEQGDGFSVSQWFADGFLNEQADPMLNGYQPHPDSLALGNGEAPFDSFFDFVDYVGAFDGTNDWAGGWMSTATK